MKKKKLQNGSEKMNNVTFVQLLCTLVEAVGSVEKFDSTTYICIKSWYSKYALNCFLRIGCNIEKPYIS